jgi:biotin synthase
MQRREILSWLKETDESRLEELWRQADAVRRESVGRSIHLRGLVEISNYCRRGCAYCGIRAGNAEVERYRMSSREIVDCARQAVDFGYGTVVLQAGEDPGIDPLWMSALIGRIKAETPLAVTLSLGERHPRELEAWRKAGADRYLLRFETANPRLFRRVHPGLPGGYKDRMEVLEVLRSLGYEVGSGMLIGLPGQTWEDLATDIETIRDLRLHMIGVGPYIAHPDTPLGKFQEKLNAPQKEQTPGTPLLTWKVLALLRILCPKTNIPSTTALATVGGEPGGALGLERGANVIMPNLTPVKYREKYEIYPDKSGFKLTPEQAHHLAIKQIRSLGRKIGAGRGDSPLMQAQNRMSLAREA